MEIVNRSLVMLFSNEQMVEFINAFPEFALNKISMEEINDEPLSLMIPEFDEFDKAIGFLNQKKVEIFKIQVESWVGESESLDDKLNIKIESLEDWFDVVFSSMVIDLDYVPISKEELVIE